MIKVVVAQDPNGLIGKNNKLPWHNAVELAHFYQAIDEPDAKILMGRKTYESIPKKRFGDRIVVLTRAHLPGVHTITKSQIFQFFKKYANSDFHNLFIIGGKTLYEEFYTYAQELIISVMDATYEGDTFIKFDLSGFKLASKVRYDGFAVYHYIR